ncbi:MAG: (2Fe-2S) ferredoxin domain-containing protein [Planctomycetes bacterium]|nr:(2Fe-2S) ferredoxin domain-containing protein [Planctomycetota bacterium]
MVTVTVCVGSSCHLKGARQVIERFNELLSRHKLGDRVTLKGSFCMERCGEGINWQIDDEPVSSTTGEEALRVFYERVLAPMGVRAGDGPGGPAGP